MAEMTQVDGKILIKTIQVNFVLIPRDEATQIDLNCCY